MCLSVVVLLISLLITCKTSEINLDNNENSEDTVFNFNITHLLLQSILFCGPEIICNKSILTLFHIPNLPFDGTTRCERCLCNEECASRFPPKNCCPDVYFRHGLRECQELNILSRESDYKYAVSSCPVGTNDKLSLECSRNRSRVNLLFNPPVSSNDSYVAYKNKYCASCNNASELVDWNVKFRCNSDPDFNYLSTYQEIIDLAIAESCDILYLSPIASLITCYDEKNVISTCNVSGTWIKYDKQIDKACRSSYAYSMGVFDIFKNIFCVMCNPPKFEKSLISQDCGNSTSVYKNICSTFPVSEASSPYKNFFCFLCGSDGDHSIFFTDVNFRSAEEERFTGSSFQVTIFFDYIDEKVNQFLEKTILENTKATTIFTDISLAVNHSKPICAPTYNSLIPPWLGPIPPPSSLHLPSYSNVRGQPNEITAIKFSSINVKSLILKSFAFTKHGACTDGLLPNYTKSLQLPCSCSIGCTSDCCDDFAFKQPWVCIDNRYQRDGDEKDFLAIGGCLQDKTIEHMCMENYTSHFYFAFPVSSSLGNSESYVNIFCYLCNKDKRNDDMMQNVYNTTSKVRVWPLILDCKTYINYRNFRSLKQLLNYANRISCVSSFSPPADAQKCHNQCDENQSKAIKKCNVSGTWESFDQDVLLACEYAEIFRFPMIMIDVTYKNKFCRLCNPFKEPEIPIYCEGLSGNIVLSCRELPSVKTCFPFKNAFCEMCDNDTSSQDCYIIPEEPPVGIPGIIGTREPPEPPPILFRKVFSLTAYDTASPPNLRGFTCSQYQMFDDSQELCRNLTCFPGKHLINNTCKFLLPVSSNLRYSIGLKIKLPKFISVNVTIYEALDATKDWISEKLKSVLDTAVLVEDLILMTFENCKQPFYKLRDIYVYIKIYIPQNVQREEIETKLLNLNETFSDLISSYEYVHLIRTPMKPVNISISKESIFLPSILRELDTTKVCVDSTGTPYVSSKARTVVVSSLLACKQVILESKESDEVRSNLRKEFSFPGGNVSFYSFESTDNGDFRVCVQDLSYFTRLQSEEHAKIHISTLEILTLVCLAVSLVSLVITFITYSLFSSLRTIPGLNNMCLVLSLFLAQLMLIVMPFLQSTRTGHIIVFSLSHFSWLATFFWFQVCSFHMFRVFTSKSRSSFQKSQTKKIIIRYALYGFGIPALIVSANIIITLIVTKGNNSGYDNISTLLTYKVAFIVILLVPLSFVCITNLIFYVLTAYKIYSTPQVENKTGNKMHFSVYVKLFTLTGLSWLLHIIDMFLVMTFLSYVVSVLNGLQGLFIFISYVCNRRVWRLYTDTYTRKKPLQGQTSSSNSKTGNTSI